MRHLEQIFNKLQLSKENGLFITTENDWKGLFSNRVERLLDKIIQPDAIFSIDKKPFILFFDSPEKKKEKLKQIWNFNESPIVIITEGDSIEIYNGFEFITEKDSLRMFGKTEQLSDFSYFELVTGKTWEKYQKDFSYSNRIDSHLLNNIKAARDLLIADGLSTELTNSLLGKVIFVRYLIDRNVKLDFEQEGTPREWTNTEFCNLLSDRQNVKEFFKYLKKKFNGDLFPISDDDFDSISSSNLSIIIDLLSGDKVDSKQKSLFNLYDFSIIPVEFISNVYELFIGQNQQEKQSAYYTPLFLVDYILSETVGKKLNNNRKEVNCRVLDPSCGSGIFLVETLRKIIEQYRLSNPAYLQNPDQYKAKLKQLALDNIYGIDKDKNAVNVAIFSIYLTLLDYQEPSDIESFKFPLLYKKNFFSEDFFDQDADFNKRLKNIEFDYILGNPPWKRGKGEKKPLFAEYINKRKKLEKGKYTNEIEISNREIAQAFILRVSDFCKEKTKIGFIATSKVLYNLNARSFRKYLLDQFIINKVFELAPVRKEIFVDKMGDKAVAPAVVLFYQFAFDKTTDDNIIEHITLKPSRFFSLFKVFTIQRGDYKKVVQSKLKEFDYLWKVLVYGNYLDFNFINKLNTKYKSIGEALNQRDSLIKQGLKRKDGNKKIKVPELKGLKFLNTQKKQLEPFFIKESSEKWDAEEVGYIYKKNNVPYIDLFAPYALLVTGGITTEFRSKAAINHEKRVFTSSIRAIKIYDVQDLDFLYNLNGLICSSLFSYYMLMTGSSAGIEREESEDEELINFYFVDSQKIINKSKEFETLKNNFHKTPLKATNEPSLKELDSVVLNEAKLTSCELSIIDYAVSYSIPALMKHKGYEQIFKPLRKESQELHDYINLFLKRFKESFKKNNQTVVVKVHHTNQIIGLFFKLVSINEQIKQLDYVDTNNNKVLQRLSTLGNEKITDRLFIQKDIRGFEKDGFYIVKPNEKRLWHKAIAHLDLNEFTDAMLTAGKKHRFNVR